MAEVEDCFLWIDIKSNSTASISYTCQRWIYYFHIFFFFFFVQISSFPSLNICLCIVVFRRLKKRYRPLLLLKNIVKKSNTLLSNTRCLFITRMFVENSRERDIWKQIDQNKKKERKKGSIGIRNTLFYHIQIFDRVITYSKSDLSLYSKELAV